MNRFLFFFFLLMAAGSTKAQNEGAAFSVQVGEATVYLLSEGQQTGALGVLVGATPEMIARTIPSGRFSNAVNAFLIRMPKRNILVDTGFGRQLFDQLKAIGVAPADITDILLTHMHGDHIGGLLKDGRAAFPKARLYIAHPEYEYWTKLLNHQAINVLNIYRDQFLLFRPQIHPDGDELLPGILSLATYGHTPGHTSFLLRSGDYRMLIWGDITHAMAIQMPYPQVAVSYDVDPEEAVRTRRAILKYVSENKIPVAGMHISYPGMGMVSADSGGGYVFAPFVKK
jgi:glyoxylase-like metal-dependent hydrolase (beta-lactamase superfamily II)